MKYLLIALTFALSGFFAGYIMFRSPAGPAFEANQSNRAVLVGSTLSQTLIATKTDAAQYPKFDDIGLQNTVFDQLFITHQIAAHSTPAELEQYLDTSIRSDDPLYRYNLVSIFLERYTSLDPIAAIDFIMDNPRFNRDTFVTHIVTSWVRHDPEMAVDYFLSIQDQRLKYIMGARLLEDPTIASSALRAEVAGVLAPYSDQLVQRARFRRLNPEQAFSAALQLNGGERMSQLRGAVIRWIQIDPESALEQISLVENLQERNMLLQISLANYARVNPEAALAYVETTQADTNGLQMQILHSMARQNAKTALPFIEQFVTRTGQMSPLTTLLASWVSSEPVAALAYADTLTDDQKQKIFPSLAHSYAASYPEDALNWIVNLAPGDSKFVTRAIASTVNENTIGLAENLLEQGTNSEIRGQLISSVAQYKAKANPSAALDWLNNYQSDRVYEDAVRNILIIWSVQDPAGAAKIIIESQFEKKTTRSMTTQIARNWFQIDQTEALNWVERLPEGAARNNATAGLITLLVQQDKTEDAISMLADLPPGRQHDSARLSIAYSLISKEPDRFDEIVQSLNLDDSTVEQLRTVAQNSLARLSQLEGMSKSK